MKAIQAKKHKHIKSKCHRNQVICPYCGGQALLRDASYVHQKPLYNLRLQYLYVCIRYPKCNAYVSVYPNTLKPMGPLANAELRRKRREAHIAFDKLWRMGIFSRDEAYKWLTDLFFINGRAHIARLSEDRCTQLVLEAAKVIENRIAVQGKRKAW